jgi:hypothetical protein
LKALFIGQQVDAAIRLHLVMVETFGAAVESGFQFIGMNELIARSTLQPAGKPVFLGSRDFDLRLFSAKKSHGTPIVENDFYHTVDSWISTTIKTAGVKKCSFMYESC